VHGSGHGHPALRGGVRNRRRPARPGLDGPHFLGGIHDLRSLDPEPGPGEKAIRPLPGIDLLSCRPPHFDPKTGILNKGGPQPAGHRFAGHHFYPTRISRIFWESSPITKGFWMKDRMPPRSITSLIIPLRL